MAIFNLEDFEFVKVDVPSGYTQGQTHPSIEFIPSGFLGYNYWLGTTPYANFNTNEENPCLYYANARPDGKPPVVFTPHVSNPIVPRQPFNPSTGYHPYNSDIELLFDVDKIIVLNRAVAAIDPLTNGTSQIIYSVSVTSLSSVPEQELILSKYEGGNASKFGVMSPALLKVNGKYRIYSPASSGGSVNVKCYGLMVFESDTMTRNFKRLQKGSIFGGNIELWHIDVFTHGGKFYALVNGTDWSSPLKTKPNRLFLAESSNGYDFFIYKKPLIELESYRASGYVDSNGLFICYASLVSPEHKVYSVDGREIVLITKDFTTLLNELRI